jgi:hypothetical protein
MRASKALERLAAQDLPTPQAWARATVPADELRRQVGRIDAAGSSCDVAAQVVAQRRAPRWRLLVTAAVVIALTATGLIFGPGLAGRSGQAVAATPPLLSYHALATPVSAKQLLLELAKRAGRQPAMTPGKYAYVKTQHWYLADAQEATPSGHGGAISTVPVVASIRQRWVSTAMPLSGRIYETKGGHSTEEIELRPPEPAMRILPPVAASLPTDPDRLARALKLPQPSNDTYEWFGAVRDVAGAGPVPPTVQRTLLSLLAARSSIVILGAVTDRGGRSGVALATTATTSGVTIRYILIFNSVTGALLDYEEVTLRGGDLPVQLPATTSYTLWLESGYANSEYTAPGVR